MAIAQEQSLKPKRRGTNNMSRRRKNRGQTKVHKVMHEYKTGSLHSGSKRGPTVTNRKQAIAIALSEARRSTRRRKK